LPAPPPFRLNQQHPRSIPQSYAPSHVASVAQPRPER
jgi:hypothetical protein